MDKLGPARTKMSAADAATLPIPTGRASSQAFKGREIEMRFYAPRGRDEQTPHDQDEIYAVIAGTGIFQRGRERMPFAPGDLLFVGAGEDHRFDSFTPDFATWVIFFGPRRADPPT